MILILGIVFSLIFGFLQAAGMFLLLKENLTLSILIILFILYFLLISGPVGGPKYRIPIEPVLIILQSHGMVGIYNFFTNLKVKLLKKRHSWKVKNVWNFNNKIYRLYLQQ